MKSLNEARARALWRSAWLEFKNQEKLQSSLGWDKSWQTGGNWVTWVLEKEVRKCSNLLWILTFKPTKFANGLIVRSVEKRREIEGMMLVFTKMKIRGREILECRNQEFYLRYTFILCKVRLTSRLEVKGGCWTWGPRKRSVFKSLAHRRSIKL